MSEKVQFDSNLILEGAVTAARHTKEHLSGVDVPIGTC